jgi:hypothetical protein
MGILRRAAVMAGVAVVALAITGAALARPTKSPGPRKPKAAAPKVVDRDGGQSL